MKLLKTLALVMLAGTLHAAASSPPAGHFIIDVSTFGSVQAMNITSATIRQQLYLPYATANQCLQTDILKNVVSAACVSGGGGGGGNPLTINENSVQITSPTLGINFLSPPFLVTAVSAGTTAQLTLDASSATLLGNTFNGASQLVQNTFAGALPALSAVNLTNIPSANLSGPVPAANLSNAIINQNTLQTGATFYVSSGTLSNANGLPLHIDQPGVGVVSQGIAFSQRNAQKGYLRQNNYGSLCSDIASNCYTNAFELGWSTSSYFFNQDGRFFTSQGTLRPNRSSSVIGGSLIIGGTGNYNYTDIQDIGDGNLFVNNGIIASTINVQGTGDGKITLTVASSTYTVTYSSGPLVAGQCVIVSSSTGGLESIPCAVSGGTPGGSTTQLQYNNAGSFGGFSSSVITTSSFTITSNVSLGTTTILSFAPSSNNTGGGILDVYGSAMGVGKNIAVFGSSTRFSVFRIRSGTYPDSSAYGLLAGAVLIGDTANGNDNRLQANGDIHNYVDLRSTNTMQFHTDGTGTVGDMMFWPAETLMLNVSTATGITAGISGSTSTLRGLTDVSGSTISLGNVYAGGSAGANGQVLTSAGSNQPVAWTTLAGGSGSSSLAVGTGALSGYTSVITSSPTAIILFDSAPFTTHFNGGTTAFVSLNPYQTNAAGVGTQVTTFTVSGNLAMRGGLYVSTWTSAGTGGVVTATYQAGTGDQVIFASASAGAFTVTLPPATNSTNQVITVYKSDSSTQVVTVRANGTDFINGTTQQFVLNAIGQSGEVVSGAGGWWEHGGGIHPTPFALNALGKQNASVAIGVSSSVYTCAIDIPAPVAVTGFRYTGIAMAAPGQISFGLFDKSGNLVVSTGPVYGVVGLGSVSLGSSYANVPAGQYYIGTQGSNSAISMAGAANAASNPFCEVTAETAMGMPATVTVVGGSATGRNFSTWLTVNGGRTTE